MLYAEHVAAASLRYARLKAYAPRSARGQTTHWLLQLIGLRVA